MTMVQLQLKYHPILTVKEIFAANKAKLPHTDRAFIMILRVRCSMKSPMWINMTHHILLFNPATKETELKQNKSFKPVFFCKKTVNYLRLVSRGCRLLA